MLLTEPILRRVGIVSANSLKYKQEPKLVQSGFEHLLQVTHMEWSSEDTTFI